MSRREFLALFLVALAPLVPEDFGFCDWCRTWHDLEIPCREYLDDMSHDIFMVGTR